MEMKRTAHFGSLLEKNQMVSCPSPIIQVPGHFQNQPTQLSLNEDLLSKHMLFIGGTGSGKTNAFYPIVAQIKAQLAPEDILIIFDTKGDFYELFGTPQDFVIGNSRAYANQSARWNVFREILADGWEDANVETNAQELSWSVFREAIERSKDPFFPNAARDLFASILLCLIQTAKNDDAFKRSNLYNGELKRAFTESTIQDIKRMLEAHPSLSSVLSYIGDGNGEQALGVYAEMVSCFRKLFTGVFADKGMFSMRNFVRRDFSAQSRTLFIEYDMSIGNSLAPIYSLLFDLALKETLGRNHQNGNVYLICDEFRLLPHLQHIDDGVNFGRSLGVKIIAGLQSINQLTEVYGEARGKNVAAGFSSVVAFRANDADTRKFVTELYGKNVILESRKNILQQIDEKTRGANVVEDWDMYSLGVGEAVIGFPFHMPFKFQFDLYRRV